MNRPLPVSREMAASCASFTPRRRWQFYATKVKPPRRDTRAQFFIRFARVLERLRTRPTPALRPPWWCALRWLEFLPSISINAAEAVAGAPVDALHGAMRHRPWVRLAVDRIRAAACKFPS